MAEVILTGKDFVLRKLTIEDIPSVAKHANCEDIAKNTLKIVHPYTKSDAEDWIRRTIKKYEASPITDFVFAIDIKGEAVGSVGIHHIARGHKAEIGYWLSEDHWGKGIMTEAIGLACEFAFKKFNLKRIDAHVFWFNKASARVLEKNGFENEGFMKNFEFKDGKPIDVYMFAKTI